MRICGANHVIRAIHLPWRSDVHFNPEAVEYPMPYEVVFDGATGIETAHTSRAVREGAKDAGPGGSSKESRRAIRHPLWATRIIDLAGMSPTYRTYVLHSFCVT